MKRKKREALLKTIGSAIWTIVFICWTYYFRDDTIRFLMFAIFTAIEGISIGLNFNDYCWMVITNTTLEYEADKQRKEKEQMKYNHD